MKKFADILVLTAGILWGFAGLFVNYLGKMGFSTIEISALRWFFASFIMFFAFLILKPEKLKIRLRDIWYFVCTGIVCLLSSSTLYFVTIPLTTVAVANTLMYTSPIWILIFSLIFFKEKLTFIKVISIFLVFGGCIFVTGIIGSQSSFTTLGIITGLLSGLFYALYSIFGKFVLKKYDSITSTLYTVIFAGIGSLFIIDIPDVVTKVWSTNSILPVLLVSIIITILPYTLYTAGLKYAKPTRVAVMAAVEPATSTLAGTFILAQPFTLVQLIGIIMILGAGLILQIRKSK